jgi:hypothetical protein
MLIKRKAFSHFPLSVGMLKIKDVVNKNDTIHKEKVGIILNCPFPLPETIISDYSAILEDVPFLEHIIEKKGNPRYIFRYICDLWFHACQWVRTQLESRTIKELVHEWDPPSIEKPFVGVPQTPLHECCVDLYHTLCALAITDSYVLDTSLRPVFARDVQKHQYLDGVVYDLSSTLLPIFPAIINQETNTVVKDFTYYDLN